MTETLTTGQIYEADYSRRTILYGSADNPGVVLRRPKTKADVSDPIIIERDKGFAELVMNLEERYGIRTPAMRLTQTDVEGDLGVFIGGQWVEGKHLSDESAQIPAPMVRQAVEAIIDYYRDAQRNGGSYLRDLRPSNIVYGRGANDNTDELYFIDLEPLWWEIGAGHPL